MKIVLTCFVPSDSFGPLTRLQPPAILPVLNKPLLQQHIEDCVSSGFRDIHIAAVDHPISVRTFVGDGARWGANVKVWTFKEPCSGREVVSRLSSQLDDAVLVLPVEQCLDFPLDELISLHKSHKGNCSRVMMGEKLEAASHSDERTTSIDRMKLHEPIDSGIFIVDFPPDFSNDTKDIVVNCAWIQIDSPPALWAANMACLEGFFPLLSTWLNAEGASGIRSGHHTVVERSAAVTEPTVLGNFASVRAQASVGPYAVIGDNTIIDTEAVVRSSLVFNDVYLGSQTTLENMIAVGNSIMNVTLNTWVTVPDRFLLSDVKDKIFAPWTANLFSKFVAAVLLLVTSPIWVGKGLLRKASGKTFFTREDPVCLTYSEEIDGVEAFCNPSLLGFANSHGLISRLPAIIDVLRGRLALVGVRRLRELDGLTYTEDWARQRFDSPAGLFTPVDAEAIKDASEEEKIIVENLYVANRSFKENLRVLAKSLLNLLSGRA